MRTPQPLSTCIRVECQGCAVRESVRCHFRLGDLARFLAIALPGLLMGALAVRLYDVRLLVAWVVVGAAFFALVEVRVLCSHCPHYAQPGRFLACWANYGSPKLWRYRPGALSVVEKLVLFSGFGVIWGVPAALAYLGGRLALVALIVLATAGAYAGLRRCFCARCMNFACPLNRVGAPIRKEFLKLNPSVAAERVSLA